MLTEPRPAPARLREVVRQVSIRHVALAGFGLIVLLGVLGAIEAHSPYLDVFDLDGERNVPADWSALLLLAAGGTSIVNGVIAPGGVGWQWHLPGALFVLMAADELQELHESLETRTGVDWQLLYLPAFAVSGGAGVLLVRSLRSLPVARWFVAGAICWAGAQVLEKVQWSGNETRGHYAKMMIPEELLEMSGSLLFLLTALFVLQRTTQPTEAARGALSPVMAPVEAGLPS